MNHSINNITNEEEYNLALIEVEKLIDFDPKPGTKDCNRLEFLSDLITEYEDKHYPIDIPSEKSLKEFRRDQMQINNKR